MKVLPALLGLSLLLFGGLTSWAMTVHGIFEEASIDVGTSRPELEIISLFWGLISFAG